MKVKVPQKIRIGGWDYSIVLLLSLADEGLAGAHNSRQIRIEINPERPKEKWMEALIHELIHAVSHVYLNHRLGEDDVSGIGEGLYQIFGELGIEFDFSDIHHKP